MFRKIREINLYCRWMPSLPLNHALLSWNVSGNKVPNNAVRFNYKEEIGQVRAVLSGREHFTFFYGRYSSRRCWSFIRDGFKRIMFMQKGFPSSLASSVCDVGVRDPAGVQTAANQNEFLFLFFFPYINTWYLSHPDGTDKCLVWIINREKKKNNHWPLERK